MFIQTETTPNPETLKFLPGKEVLGDGTRTYESREDTASSPLAQALFGVDGVNAIFLGSDFISVTKDKECGWNTLKPLLLTTIMEHFVAGIPVILDADADNKAKDAEGSDEDDTPIIKQLKELIETRVRPAVAQDGGDIIFKAFDEDTGVVQLELHGACSGCPSSTVTLKHGIENMLKHYVPEVTSVEAVN